MLFIFDMNKIDIRKKLMRMENISVQTCQKWSKSCYTHTHTNTESRFLPLMTLCKYLSMSFRGTDNYIEGTHPTGWQASKCVRASHASASVCVYGCVHYCTGIWYKKVYPCVWTGGYRHRLENVFLCSLMTHLLTAVSYKDFLMRSTNPD